MAKTGNVGKVSVDIVANIKELKTGINKANERLNSFSDTAKKISSKASSDMAKMSKNITKEMKKTSDGVYDLSKRIMNSIKGFIIYRGINFMVESLTEGVKNAVRSFNEMEAGIIGLRSIVEGQGRSFSRANEFVKSYINDGIVPLTDAVTAYKNLAMRGYTDKQIESTLLRLKDAASFGRQASLTIGQAVKTATEGLKNENSILVDNAGVTKNVSMMWADYARSIGKGEKSLSKAEKIQAEVNGIMEETRFQVGNAAKYTSTLAGKMSALSTQAFLMKVAIGSALAPVIERLIPLLIESTKRITTLFEKISQYTGALFKTKKQQTQQEVSSKKAAKQYQNLGDAITDAAKDAKKGLASFDEINELTNGIAESSELAAKNIEESSITDDMFGDDIGQPTTNKPIIPEVTNIIPQAVIDSFKRLNEALEPFKENVGNGLKWFYDNVLVPLGKYIVKEVVPTYLNGLSAAIKLLNSAIDGVKPMAKWLFENLLNPLSNWVGDIAIASIKGVVSVLTSFSNWAQTHKETVATITEVIAGFFAVWKVTQLLAFIQMSGSIVTAFKRIREAIYLTTIAKVIDGIETIYLTALYAKDFIVSIAKTTVKIVAQTLAWIGHTIAVGAARVKTLAMVAASKLAAFAMLTLNKVLALSPWVWVAAAVAAVTAAIIYFWQTNEGFRKFIHKAWKEIRLVFDWAAAGIIYGFENIKIWLTESLPLYAAKMKSALTLTFLKLGKSILGIFDDIKFGVIDAINYLIGKIDALLSKISGLTFKMPKILGGKEFKIGVGTLGKITKEESTASKFAQGAYELETAKMAALYGKEAEIRQMYENLYKPSEHLASKMNEYAQEAEYEAIDFSKITDAFKGMMGLGEALDLEERTNEDTLSSNIVNGITKALEVLNIAGSAETADTKQAILNIDGNEFARAIIPYINGENQRTGTAAIQGV